MLLPTSAYKILFIPQPIESHIFSLAAIAEGLADRSHEVTFLVGEHFPLNLPELSNRRNISVVRHTDTTADGVQIDYNAIGEAAAESAIEGHGDIMHVASIVSKMYVNLCLLIAFIVCGALNSPLVVYRGGGELLDEMKYNSAESGES